MQHTNHKYFQGVSANSLLRCSVAHPLTEGNITPQQIPRLQQGTAAAAASQLAARSQQTQPHPRPQKGAPSSARLHLHIGVRQRAPHYPLRPVSTLKLAASFLRASTTLLHAERYQGGRSQSGHLIGSP